MKQAHQVSIDMYDGGLIVFLRQQESSTMWVHEAYLSHATAKRPVNIA